jgi:hypothetical protein
VILETVTCLVLHCSRCNTPFRDDVDDDYSGVDHWPTRVAILKQFHNDFAEYGGWRRFGSRYVCSGCQISNGYGDDPHAREFPEPLPPAEADKVTRAQAAYARTCSSARGEVQAAVEEIDSGSPHTARQILTTLLNTLDKPEASDG